MGDVIFFFSFKLSKCSTSELRKRRQGKPKKQVSFSWWESWIFMFFMPNDLISCMDVKLVAFRVE